MSRNRTQTTFSSVFWKVPDWCCHSEAPPTGREFQKRSPAAEKLLSPGGVRVLCPSGSQQSRSQGWARVGGVLAKIREKLKIWQEYSQHCLMDRQMRVAAAGVKMQDDAPVSDADREKVLQNVIVWKIFREGLVFWWEITGRHSEQLLNDWLCCCKKL